MLRQKICRVSPIVAVLVTVNLTLLLLSSLNTFPDILSSDPSGTEPVTTITVAESISPTVSIETPTPPLVKPPGPAFCNICSPEDVLCAIYGDHNLARSRVYEGTNARLRRVIADALAGRPTNIGVLGGSVTKGHGLHNNADNWINRFLVAWKELFPASETTLTNGAVPATGSDYLSMCFGEHIEPVVDLIIVELAINDQRIEESSVAYEWLLRGLLALPKNPAIVNLHTMALSFDRISTGGDLHTPVAEYYDVPIVSLRNMLVGHVIKHPELDEHYFAKLENGEPDWRHVSLHGHKLMADLLVAYTQRQLCAVVKHQAQPTTYAGDHKLPETDSLDVIPRLRLLQKYDRQTVNGRITPWCQSARTEKHPLTPIENNGWRPWIHRGQHDKPYLLATEPGAMVKFAVMTAVMGRVRITYLRSKTFGLGDLLCWLDDDKANATRVISWWDRERLNLATVETIAEHATPGAHVLTCEVMQETSDPGGGHEFRLIAIDAA